MVNVGFAAVTFCKVGGDIVAAYKGSMPLCAFAANAGRLYMKEVNFNAWG